MGLVDKNYPIFFYRNLPKSATGRAFDEVVTPSAIALFLAVLFRNLLTFFVELYAAPSDFHLDSNIALFSTALKSFHSRLTLLLIRNESFFLNSSTTPGFCFSLTPSR